MADYSGSAMDATDLESLRVIDLKNELERRRLPKSGNKKELIERLRAHMGSELGGENSQTHREDQVSALQIGGGEPNEVVQKYLAQRSKLLEKQMEERKRFEEEEIETGAVALAEQAAETVHVNDGRQSNANDADNHASERLTTAARKSRSRSSSSSSGTIDRSRSRSRPSDGELQTLKAGVHDVEMKSTSFDASAAVQNEPVPSNTSKGRSSESGSSGSESRSPSPAGKPRSRSPSAAGRQHLESKSLLPEGRKQSSSRILAPADRKTARSNSSSEPESDNEVNDKSSIKVSSKTSHQEAEEDEEEIRARALRKAMTTTSEEHTSPTKKMEEEKKEEKKEDSRNLNATKKRSSGSTNDATTLVTSISKSNEHMKVGKDSGISDKPVEIGSSINGTAHSIELRSKPPRKRTWGSSTNKSNAQRKASININTESLKSIIPDIMAFATSKSFELMELSAPAESISGSESESEKDEKKKRTDAEKVPDSRRVVKEKTIVTRTVFQELDEGEMGGQKMEVESGSGKEGGEHRRKSTDSKQNGKPETESRARGRQVLLTVDEPKPVRRRSPSPPRHTPTPIIHVHNLVRPYTIGQLKELLGHSGTILPDSFWIDKIKSHCVVAYESVEQAVAARHALHGKQWPSSNPKILHVDFATQDELDALKSAETGGPEAKKPAQIDQRSDERRRPDDKSHERAETDRDRRKSSPSLTDDKQKTKENVKPIFPIREWDRDKIRQSRSRSPVRARSNERGGGNREREKSREERRRHRDGSRERRDGKREGATEAVPEEPPAKLLDDLFRKTKATPCIYWLPLTGEQIAEKEAKKNEEEAERAKRRMEREKQMEEERERRERGRDERTKERRGGRDQSRGESSRDRKTDTKQKKAADDDDDNEDNSPPKRSRVPVNGSRGERGQSGTRGERDRSGVRGERSRH